MLRSLVAVSATLLFLAFSCSSESLPPKPSGTGGSSGDAGSGGSGGRASGGRGGASGRGGAAGEGGASGEGGGGGAGAMTLLRLTGSASADLDVADTSGGEGGGGGAPSLPVVDRVECSFYADVLDIVEDGDGGFSAIAVGEVFRNIYSGDLRWEFAAFIAGPTTLTALPGGRVELRAVGDQTGA